jgi:hypothetical protein
VSHIEQRVSLGRAVEHGCLWAICAGSLVLWFALYADFGSALWWAVKTPGPLGSELSSVRLDKVLTCLFWSVMALGSVAWRYDLAKARVLLLLGISLLVLFVASIVQIILNLAVFVLPPSALMSLGIVALLLLVAKVGVATRVAYVLLARDSFPRRHVAIAVALTFAACCLMIWIGLFDVLYPGISWRPAVIRP